MLRTVVQPRSLVRLRSSLRCAAPSTYNGNLDCDLASASRQFLRCFTAAPTNDLSLSQPYTVVKPPIDAVEDDPVVADTTKTSPNNKKRRQRNRKRPSTAQAEALFDEIAPHMPLRTLLAITKRLKKTKLSDNTTSTRVGKVHNLLETPEMPEWTQQRFKEFLLQSPKEQMEVNANNKNEQQQQLESNIELLEKARDLAAQRPLLWSLAQRKKVQHQKKAAATDDADPVEDTSLDETALALYSQKSKETRREEAQELAVLLAERLPQVAHSQLMSVFASYVESSPMRMLYSNLEKCAKAHTHLVAPQVATFFHVKHAEHDPRLKKHEKEWTDAREAFGETMLQIYDSLQEKGRTQKERSAETLGELDRLRTRPSDGVKIGRDRQGEQGKDGRRKKHVHLVFDAISLQDSQEPSSVRHAQYQIFVDNLPVDMEESELIELYSRCGLVESVQIFNRREELDPGPRTAKQRHEQRLKQKKSMTHNRRRWKRPRTPVYGTVTFGSQEGYDFAVDASMCLFGMVVRKHPMRSIRATDMTTLYLEDIPAGMYSLDIEHKLSKLLHPEIYVCLDVGQHDYAEPSSCEIKFPTFEMAHHAYHKLQDLDMEGTVLNWMRTPEDAEKYWTREYTFET